MVETGPRVLLVEDEPSLALSVGDRLTAEGYVVEVAGDGNEAFERARRGGFDLILLDLMLPGRGGLDVCRDLRAEGVSTPILMLTARSQVVDKVLGLKLGADDYLAKPFEMIELLARIEALLRRGGGEVKTEVDRFRFGRNEVDFRRAEVLRDGEPVEVSALEFKLLRYLIQRRGELLGRDELLDEVWGYDATPVTRTVDVHVASLRRKLEDVPSRPRYIQTVRGLGYRFEAE